MGPAKTLALLGAPAVAALRATKTSWCCRNGRIPGIPQNRLCESLCHGRRKGETQRKRRGAKSCQTGEEWREMSRYSRNAERREEGKGGKRGSEERGEWRRGGDGPPAQHLHAYASVFKEFNQSQTDAWNHTSTIVCSHRITYESPFNTYSSRSRQAFYSHTSEWRQQYFLFFFFCWNSASILNEKWDSF